MKSQQEEFKKIGIVIYDTDNEEDSDGLKKAARSVVSAIEGYPQEKIKLILCSYSDKNIADVVTIVNQTKVSIKKTEAVFNLQKKYKNVIDYSCFSKLVGADFLVRMNHDSVMRKSDLAKINNLGDETMVVTTENESGVVAFPSAIVSKNYLEHNEFELMSKSVIKMARDLGKLEYFGI